MEQVHYIALTVLVHPGSNHTSSPSAAEKGLGWDDPADELAYRAAQTPAAAPDPVLGGASMLDHEPDELPVVVDTAVSVGSRGEATRGREVTLYNAPPRVVALATKAAAAGLWVALQTWAPAPENWAPAWTALLLPRLGAGQLTSSFAASGRPKWTITWTSTAYAGGLHLPYGKGLSADERPVYQVRRLCEEPALPNAEDSVC